MTPLLPHVVIRTRSTDPSQAAIALRAGGYAVTKVVNDEFTMLNVDGGHADGVVLEVSTLHAIGLARRIREATADLPIVVINNSASSIRAVLTGVPNLVVMSASEVGEDLVRAVDRLLANVALMHADGAVRAAAG